MSRRLPPALACLARLFPATARAAAPPPQVSPVSSTIAALPAGSLSCGGALSATGDDASLHLTCAASTGLTLVK
jgi:hypothetical protein